MTSAYAALALVAFVVGVIIGRFERADRHVAYSPPSDITPSLAHLRAWRKDRR